MTDNKEELLKLIEHVKLLTRLTQAEMSEAMGYEKTYISKMLKNGVTDKFLKAFKNHGWDVAFGDTPNKETGLTYLQKRNQQKNQPTPYMVPFVPVKAQAGYVRAIDQSMFVDAMEKYAIPPGVDYHGAIWRYWEIEGDSMEPSFHSGDIILTSQVHKMDWEQLRNFYLYVIVTEERVIFKRLYCMNPLEWVLISENEEHYPQQILQAESVKEVWVYRRSIVNKAPVPKMYEIKVKPAQKTT